MFCHYCGAQVPNDVQFCSQCGRSLAGPPLGSPAGVAWTPPAGVRSQTGRWIGEGHARHAIFNLKLPMKKRYAEVSRCEAIIRDALEQAHVRCTLRFAQLYHDREEITGYCARVS